ncbi:Uu.00g063950.m01.CDS01 [Anthostomella pinea]|uniref:Uu.00g063950.m01.CDS01 n=1 Tax=Anthostomella pinea TaxID=933095 RepID=A0AAI8VUB1_9PEZI|nr:Uu.00g063950.m01.CDS01 [Anthostomella pinea]
MAGTTRSATEPERAAAEAAQARKKEIAEVFSKALQEVDWTEVLPWEELINNVTAPIVKAQGKQNQKLEESITNLKDSLEFSDKKHSARFKQLKLTIESDKLAKKEIDDQVVQIMNLQGQLLPLLEANGIKKAQPTHQDDAFPFSTNPQEKRVKSAWNEAVLQDEVDTFQNTSEKNKVALLPELRLQAALVPYENWAQRTAIEMSGDFQQVAIFTRAGSVNWVTFLEAILQVLSDHQVLYGSMVSFNSLLPAQNESMLNFTRRMREAWYKLPTTYRAGVMNREGVINLIPTPTKPGVLKIEPADARITDIPKQIIADPRLEDNKYVIVEATFRTISIPSGYTKPFQVSAGLVPNGTFPANLTIGRTVFYTWGFQFGNGSITLTNYPSSPILKPIPQDRAHLFSEPAYKADEPVREGPAKEIKVKWSHKTPTDNAQINEYLASYERDFPGLFDPAKRRTDVLTKTVHTIDTRDSLPVKLPPRRYSPPQVQAMKDFVNKHEGKIIRKGKGP